MKTFSKIALFGALILIISACAQKPRIGGEVSPKAESRGLYPVSGVPFDKLFVKSEFALDGYNALYFETLNLDNLVIDESRLEFRDRPWTFSDDEKADVKRWFAEEAAQVLKRNDNWSSAEGSGPGVLAVAFEFIEFAPSASKDDIEGRPLRVHVFTRSVGDLHVRARLTDANTGELVAYLEDREEVGDSIFLERNDRVNNVRLLRLEMERWISQLADTLNKI